MPTPTTPSQMNSQIDQDVTNKTAFRSITPTTLGTLLKTIISFCVSFFIPTSQKGAVNGVATLGADGKVPNGQLPISTGDKSQPTIRYKNDISNMLTAATNGRILVLKPDTKDIVKLPQTSQFAATQAKFEIPVADYPKGNTTLSYFTANLNGAQVNSNLTMYIKNAYNGIPINEEIVIASTKFRKGKIKVTFPTIAPVEPPTKSITIGWNDSIISVSPVDGEKVRFQSVGGFDVTFTFKDTPVSANDIQIEATLTQSFTNLRDAIQYQNNTIFSYIDAVFYFDHNFTVKLLNTTETLRYVDEINITEMPTGWSQTVHIPINVGLGNAALAIKAKVENLDNIIAFQSWQDMAIHPAITWYWLFHVDPSSSTYGSTVGGSIGAFGYTWFNNSHAALLAVIMNTGNGGYNFSYENGEFYWETASAPIDENDAIFATSLDFFTATYQTVISTIATTADAWLIGEDANGTLTNLKTYLDAIGYNSTIDIGNNTITVTANSYDVALATDGDFQIIDQVVFDYSQLASYIQNGNNGIYSQSLGIGNYQLSHPQFLQTISTQRTKGLVVNVNGSDYKLCDNVDDYKDNVIECYYLINSILTGTQQSPALYTLTKANVGIEVDSIGATQGWVSWQFGSQFDAYFGQILYLTEFVAELLELVRETAIGVQLGIDDTTDEVIVSLLSNINEVEFHPDLLAFMTSNNIVYNGINAPETASGEVNKITDSIWIVWDNGYVMPLSFVMGVLHNGQNENMFALLNNTVFVPIKGTNNTTTKFEVQEFTNIGAVLGMEN